jgi:hypothetical protein
MGCGTLIPYFSSIFQFDHLRSRRYGDSFNIRSANDHCEFGKNSDGYDGQKERDIL